MSALVLPATTEFNETVEHVAREIVATHHRGGSSFISTPLLYPSGATVVVRIDDGHPTFFVSDFGMGYNEAEMMGGGNIYSRHARTVADIAGVGFDNQAFFVIQASREQLPGAVVTIANCSQEAVAIVAHRIAERRISDESEFLYQRLESLFSPKAVTRDAEIVGASNTKWPVAALVQLGRRGAIFEPVVNHRTSVVTAAAKFHDIARLEHSPARVAVVHKKADFGTYLGVLSQAASVINDDASDAAYRKVAEAEAA